MQISPPGMFTRGKIDLGRPAPHINSASLLQELTNVFQPQGFQVYKSALIGVDVTLKKSGWTGIAIKIVQDGPNTVLRYNAFAPSAFVRVMAMGLIPILIVNATSWKPLLRQFEAYVQSSPYFAGHALPPGGQGYGQAPSFAPQQQAQPPMQQAMPQAAPPPQYPCQTCQAPLSWVQEHQRWFCGRCQQYR